MGAENQSSDQSEKRIIVDEDWKTKAQAEKEAIEKEAIEKEATEKEAIEKEAIEKEAPSTQDIETSGDSDTETDSPKHAYPPASFTSLISSLATQAAISLQGMQAEDAAPGPPDLALAKHLIDTLEVLETKTKGNLDEQESAVLSQVLRELRMIFVEVASKQNSA